MWTAIVAWLSSFVGGVVVKLAIDGLTAWQAQQQSVQNAKDAGAAQTSAKVNQATVETQDEMDNVARPSDDAVADSMRRGQF
jgi:3-mercaptopyruvate sulfurtransferase SseA